MVWVGWLYYVLYISERGVGTMRNEEEKENLSRTQSPTCVIWEEETNDALWPLMTVEMIASRHYNSIMMSSKYHGLPDIVCTSQLMFICMRALSWRIGYRAWYLWNDRWAWGPFDSSQLAHLLIIASRSWQTEWSTARWRQEDSGRSRCAWSTGPQ